MTLTIQIDDFNYLDYSNYTMPIITVYNSPLDFPGKYVARIHDIENGKPLPQPYALIKDSLEEIREVIPEQFIRMPRDPHDVVCIEEVWI